MVEPTTRYQSTENSEYCPAIMGIVPILKLSLKFTRRMITAVLMKLTTKIFSIIEKVREGLV